MIVLSFVPRSRPRGAPGFASAPVADQLLVIAAKLAEEKSSGFSRSLLSSAPVDLEYMPVSTLERGRAQGIRANSIAKEDALPADPIVIGCLKDGIPGQRERVRALTFCLEKIRLSSFLPPLWLGCALAPVDASAEALSKADVAAVGSAPCRQDRRVGVFDLAFLPTMCSFFGSNVATTLDRPHPFRFTFGA